MTTTTMTAATTPPPTTTQMFSVGLWLMDEYWYFSLFTLVMVCFMEVVVIKQRQRNLLQLRAMRRPPVQLPVWRRGAWRTLSSTVRVDVCGCVCVGVCASLCVHACVRVYFLPNKPRWHCQ
jgi:hypothetical protein